MLSADARQAAALEAMLERAGGLHAEIRRRLSQRDCEMPRHLSSSIARVAARPARWPPDAMYRLTFRRRDPDERQESRAAAGHLRITLSAGEAAREYPLPQGRTDVGRTCEVRDRQGRLIRRNAICITDEQARRSTVSRCHAHIDGAQVSADAIEYTLYDDGSTCGTRVLRDGKTIAVHPGAVGVRLRDGDELYFGSTHAMFRMTTA
jgi:hypothetical protein